MLYTLGTFKTNAKFVVHFSIAYKSRGCINWNIVYGFNSAYVVIIRVICYEVINHTVQNTELKYNLCLESLNNKFIVNLWVAVFSLINIGKSKGGHHLMWKKYVLQVKSISEISVTDKILEYLRCTYFQFMIFSKQ